MNPRFSTFWCNCIASWCVMMTDISRRNQFQRMCYQNNESTRWNRTVSFTTKNIHRTKDTRMWEGRRSKMKTNWEVSNCLSKMGFEDIVARSTHAKVALKDKTMSVEIMAVESKVRNDTGDAPHVNIKTNETGCSNVCCSGHMIQNNAPWFHYCGLGCQRC